MSEPKSLSGIAAQEYLRGADHCLFCGASDITGGAVSIEGGAALQPMSCTACGARWDDIYVLTGIATDTERHNYADNLDVRCPTCPHCGAQGERDAFDHAEVDREMTCDECGHTFWCSAYDALIYSTTTTSPEEDE